jgi:hypothetical protein
MSNTIQNRGILALGDDELATQLVSRRDAIARGAGVASAVSVGLRMATIPVALAAVARDAFGQGRLPAVVNGVLNFALVLEYLESEFYTRGLAANIIPQADLAIFQTISAHEVGHVNYLRSTLGASARPKPTFDFSAGGGTGTGPYADVFTNYATFKAVAQAFEDTGVRAYKGQAGLLIPYGAVLTAALTIHSVEARHASEVRRLRGNFTDTEPLYEGWITENTTDVPGAANTYAGEDNTTHLGVNLSGIASLSGVSHASLTEAFDEPLTMAQVLAIVSPFLATSPAS